MSPTPPEAGTAAQPPEAGTAAQRPEAGTEASRSTPGAGAVPSVLVANRGEIAVRIVRSVTGLGWRSVVAQPADQAGSWAASLAAASVTLPGSGPAAFMDPAALAAAAVESEATMLHPGYGFASEDPALAEACVAAGVTWVGPSAAALRTLGDKMAARHVAERLGIPVAAATRVGISDGEALAWWDDHGGRPVVVKAVAGGGGRGLRVVDRREDVTAALADVGRAGVGAAYLEERLASARHIEVQVVGDGTGAVTVGERDCSVQRRLQKVVEMAPAPGLSDRIRAELQRAAVALAAEAGYAGVGTVEFLVAEDRWVFLEVNPRLQVEHPVTEAVYGVDLVAAGLRIAAGERLDDLGIGGRKATGAAVEARVCAEIVTSDGAVSATAGTLGRLEAPTGPGVRTDTGVRPGDVVDPRYDTLLAKVVGHDPAGDLATALATTRRAVAELVVEGLATNADLLDAVLAHPDLTTGVDTGWLERNLGELAPAPGKQAGKAGDAVTPVTGTVVALTAAVGDEVGNGHAVALIESMKMEHPVPAPGGGVVTALEVAVGDLVMAGQVVARVDVGAAGDDASVGDEIDLDEIRPELADLLARRHGTTDEGRPEVVARRHEGGRRTARENLADLLDPGSLVEYGPLVIAAQTRRRPIDELIERTPGDGIIGGIGTVGGRSVVAMTYDYTVMAGTQGQRGHRKKDRLFDLAERLRLPLVLFAEGGGGRPGETDGDSISGLEAEAFALFAELSGRVPLIGIASGRCFAGNAALLGCCDVIIATPDANIGMGGPAMIEGGGLGRHQPEDIGPVEVQTANGVIDVLVADEVTAVATARQYLGYFVHGEPASGSLVGGAVRAADPRQARHVVPPSRTRVYDVRAALDVVADEGSVLELRPSFGVGIVTALARVEGRPVGVLANDPRHLGGAIDTPGSDKAARFLQLCDAFDLPVVSLIDTPGFMVGPDAERDAQVRHFSRMFVVGASMTVPTVAVILRKAYGLGGMAMLGGSIRRPLATLAWPTGEIGGMNLEGAVRLAFAKDLAAIDDPDERQASYDALVARAYAHGKVLHAATNLEVDDVIDPAETRARVAAILAAVPADPGWAERAEPKRPFVDTW